MGFFNTQSDPVPGRARGSRVSPEMAAACASLGLALFTALAFSPVLTAGLVTPGDADALRAGRADSRSWRAAGRVFARFERPEGTGGYYRPLTALSFASDARLARDPVAGVFQSHLTNLLLHVINAALLFTLLRRLTLLWRGEGRGVDDRQQAATWVWPALLALIFALHPLQVESVAWLAQRMTVLATFFSLLAILAYVRYRTTGRVAWLVYTSAVCMAAVLSKPTFLGLPVFLLVLDLWLPGRRPRRPLLTGLPFFLILAITAGIQFAIFSKTPTAAADIPPPMELFCTTMASFIQRMIWPVGLLPMNPFDAWGSTSHVVIWRDLAMSSLLIVLPIWAFFRSRGLFVAVVGGLLFVCPAFLDAPFSEQRLGDHHLYPVLIPGLLVAAVCLAGPRAGLRAPIPRCAALGLTALLGILAVTTYSQTFQWQDGRELHYEIVKKHPQWAPGYIGLIESLVEDNELDEAVAYAKKAVAIAPNNPSTQFYLGTALLLQTGGRAAEAIIPLRKALESNPQWIECLQNLGVALARSGQYDKAIEYLERARDAQPNSAGIRLGLGNAYLKVRRASSARRELQEALRLNNDSVTHLSLAMAWAANDAPDRARRHLEAAIAKDPRMAARAAVSEELLRFRDEPGFENLFDSTADPGELPPGEVEMPAARNTRGS